MTYFRKILMGPSIQDDKIFGGYFPKGDGCEKNFSMLVQDSLPIGTTISNVRVC
jgi:hypothetical protein